MGTGAANAGGNRAIWLLATACVLIGAVVWALMRPDAESASSHATGPAGMAGLYRLLGQEGVTLGRRSTLPLPAAGILVGAVGPAQPSEADAATLLQWVDAGNEAIVLGPLPALGALLRVETGPRPYGDAEAQAAVALPQLRAAPTLRLPGGSLLLPVGGPVGRAAPLYTVLGQPAALEVTVGSGRLYWIGSAGVWSNATLARWPGNLALAEGLLDGPRPVWFDEYWFGLGAAGTPGQAQRRAQPARPPLPGGAAVPLVALLLAAVAGLWAAGWRRHPVRRDPPAAPGASEPLLAYAEWLFRGGTRTKGGGDDRGA